MSFAELIEQVKTPPSMTARVARVCHARAVVELVRRGEMKTGGKHHMAAVTVLAEEALVQMVSLEGVAAMAGLRVIDPATTQERGPLATYRDAMDRRENVGPQAGLIPHDDLEDGERFDGRDPNDQSWR